MTLSVEDKSVLNVLPVGMQNSALVLKDEDENSITTDLGELSCANELNLNPSAINIENSSDVIIGPVTQFNGPVTIYQNLNGTAEAIRNEQNPTTNTYLNGKLVKSESTSSDSPPYTTSEKTAKNFLLSKQSKYILISLFILVIILVITITTIISLKTENKKTKSDEQKDVIDGGDDPNDTLTPIGPGSIIDKKIWGGRAALNGTIPLKHPTPYVIISHTVTPQCDDLDSCSARVRSIQDYHMVTYKSPDIGYNFLIGGDGNAYVGRGWDTKNFHSSNSIGICFIGDYISDYLTTDMISVAQKLLDYGLKNSKLAQDYKLVGHNQTFATQSPGPHVYEVIKNWLHFYPGRLKLN